MRYPSLISIAILAMTALPLAAQTSLQTSAQAGHLSGQASAQGSAAAAHTVATIVAVPLLLTGGALTVSGAGLQVSGQEALTSATTPPVAQTLPRRATITADPAPKLD